MTVLGNQIELKSGRHGKCEEGLLCSEFFIPDGCPMLDSSMICDHIDALHPFLKNEKRAFLIDLSSAENVLSFDALKKWGQSEKLNQHRLAEAYVVSTLADLIFLKQHIRLNKLDFPARVFNSLDQAKEWLQTIKPKKPHPSKQSI